jgi:Fe-S-cluster containining protein
MINLEYLLEKGGSTEVENLVKQTLNHLLKKIHSSAELEEVWPDMQAKDVFQNLIRYWSGWNKAHRENRWEVLCRELEKTAYSTRPFCLRCGECCQKGSPTLYIDDLGILRRGIIKRTELITLRCREIGFSNVTSDLVLLTEERVKVEEKPGSRHCLFFNPDDRGCRIYDDRPLQCRVMECWNPDKYQSLESHRFLSRKELLSPDDPLIPLIEAHEKRCALSQLQEALSRINRGDISAQEDALDIIFYDQHLRRVLEDQKGIGPENQVFLFGRPLSDLVATFGFGFEKNEDGLPRLVPLMVHESLPA